MDNDNNNKVMELKIYTEHIELPSGHWVDLRGMKSKEIDILASRKKMKNGDGINEICKSCIVGSSEGFNFDTALQGDRYCIIINVRRITYPGPYKFKVKCPYCGDTKMYKVNLEEMEVKYLEGRPTADLEFKFPRCGVKIIYHLPTGIDEKEMIGSRKVNKDNVMSTAMMIYTDSIEGEKFKKLEFFKNLDAYDVLALKEEIDEVGCGIETAVKVYCEECDDEFEAEMPLSKDFFLPKHVKNK